MTVQEKLIKDTAQWFAEEFMWLEKKENKRIDDTSRLREHKVIAEANLRIFLEDYQKLNEEE
tara:strand:- start:653 stop:838 length:186 start_codon:yes stop_codon:yes gene_type:complete